MDTDALWLGISDLSVCIVVTSLADFEVGFCDEISFEAFGDARKVARGGGSGRVGG